MNQIIFPELYCPFSPKINQYVDVLEDYAIEWVTHFNLVEAESAYRRFTKAQFFLLAAGTYPNCKFEEVKIANDWLSWMMTWDDLCEHSDLGKQPELLKVFHKRFIEILNGAELTSQDIPRGYALSNLRQRILQRGGGKWLPYFVHSVEDYLHGCVLESINLGQGNVPDIETCITIRQSSVAAYTFLDLIEFCDHLMIPDFLRDHDSFKKLKLMTNNVLTWCNDIFSAPKEIADGDFHNVVLVLHYQYQFSLEQAMRRTTKMYEQELEALMNLEASLPSFGEDVDAELTKYISGLYTWIRGNLDWSSRTRRYHSVENLELERESVH